MQTIWTCIAVVSGSSDPTRVRIADGYLQGAYGNNASQVLFRGVPYSAPPVGKLRWHPPLPPTPWDGVRNATTFAADCAQLGPAWASLSDGIKVVKAGETTSSEDCLYVNIYTPVPTPAEKKYPVMLYLPAGQYMWGAGNDRESNGKPELAWADTIVVTLGYRLSIFGFLCLEEMKGNTPDGSQCNFGLLDQIAAVEWLQVPHIDLDTPLYLFFIVLLVSFFR